MSSKTVRVVAHLKAKPEKVAEAQAALIRLVEETRAEDGCIVYELMQNDVDPTDFTFVEEWSSDAALNEHLQSEHIRTLQSQAEELFAAPPVIHRYALIA